MSASVSSKVAKKSWIATADRVTRQWTITTGQLRFKDDGKYIYSPRFSTGDGKEQWLLKLCQNEKDPDYISCFLYLMPSGRSGIVVKFKISISLPNKTIIERRLTHKFDTSGGWGWSSMIKLSNLLEPDDSEISIIIHCDTDDSLAKQVLAENFRSLFEHPKFSDVTIIVGDEKFSAHKNVLSVRSSVFAAMFEHKEMDENRKNEVKIEDMEPDVVKGMLEFIYSGEVADLKGLADGLLVAAEKYDLEILKASCEETLCNILDVSNAPGTLTLAHLYRADNLKRLTIKFIKDNLYDVIQTDEYKKITDHTILKDIISFDAKKK